MKERKTIVNRGSTQGKIEFLCMFDNVVVVGVVPAHKLPTGLTGRKVMLFQGRDGKACENSPHRRSVGDNAGYHQRHN